MVGGCLKPSRFSQSIVSVIHILQRFAFVRRGRSWVPSPLAGEGQGEGKSSGNESTHPNEKCCNAMEHTRRDVLKLGTLMGVSYMLGGCSMAEENIQPDLILRNGRIATQDERRSFASAVAIKDGRFLAVGT